MRRPYKGNVKKTSSATDLLLNAPDSELQAKSCEYMAQYYEIQINNKCVSPERAEIYKKLSIRYRAMAFHLKRNNENFDTRKLLRPINGTTHQA